MSDLLKLNIRRTSKELSSLAALIGKSSESRKKYHGLLEDLGGVFELLYSPSVNINALNSAAEQLLDKAQRLNDSGENLEIKQQTSQFATRIRGLKTNGVGEFVLALKKADIKSFIDLLTQELGISPGADPAEAARRRKAAEEAERKRREAEEAARKQREAKEAARKAEEAARKQREAEEADRRRREAEEAARKKRREEEQRRRAEQERRRKEEQRRKMVRIIRNSLLFALAAAAVWWFWLKDFIGGSTQPDHYVYVENLTLRSTPESGSSGNAIEMLPYGTPVQVVDTVNEEWCKVKANGKSGYVSSFYLMDSGQFNKLDSIFDGGNEYVRQLVPTSIYRKALVDFAEREAFDGNDYYYQWVLHDEPDLGYNSVSYPNLQNGYDAVPDFAFILKDRYIGQRKVALYSIDSDSNPVFIQSESAPDFRSLRKVTYNKKKKTYAFEYVTDKTPVNNSQLVPDDSGLSSPSTSDSSAKGGASGKYGASFFRGNSGYATTPSGLKYVTVEKGHGATPSPNSTVTVHYKGMLTDGTVFDSSYDRGEPTSFPLNSVIKGWKEGLQLMKVGGKTVFYIPSDLAYGTTGTSGGPIGPNADLIFEVELLSVR